MVLLVLAATTAAAQPACAPTPRDMEGPFYKPGAPPRATTGRGLVIRGAVKSAGTCTPIPGARIEWWQANREGEYDDEHRAHLVAGGDGTYRFETDPPPGYSGRPPHVHVKVFAPGHRTLTTQIYPKPGTPDLTFDLVLTRQ